MTRTHALRRSLPFLGLAALGLAAAHPAAAQLPQVPVPDGNFSTPNVGGYFQYAPSGTPWTFTSNAGISAATGPFAPNSQSVPGGSTQFGFVQGANSISQMLTGLTIGATYSLNFDTANRGGYPAQTIQTLIGGQPVSTVVENNDSYFYPIQAFFTATATSEALSFAGQTNADVTGDVTNVMVSQYTQQIAIANSGFESPNELSNGNGGFQFRPSNAGFTFTGNAAINTYGYVYDDSSNPPPPEGSQVGVLVQAGSSISQSLDGFVAGTNYVLSFDVAGRNFFGPNGVGVTLDGTTLTTLTPANPGYVNVMVPFTTTTGSHTLAFTGLGGTNAQGQPDVTSFIDNVQILGYAAAPEPSQWAGLGIGMLGLAGLAFKARKRQAV